jgi:hypothetical protein
MFAFLLRCKVILLLFRGAATADAMKRLMIRVIVFIVLETVWR